jgi:cell division protease FtsH
MDDSCLPLECYPVSNMVKVLQRLAVMLSLLCSGVSFAVSVPESQFLEDLRLGGVQSVTILPVGTPVFAGAGSSAQISTARIDSKDNHSYETQLLLDKKLFAELDLARTRYNTEYRIVQANHINRYVLLGLQALLPLLLIGGFLWFRSRANKDMGGAPSFGKSRARQVEKPKVTFREVAGCDEAKEELAEVVDFLKNPSRFHEIGARIPHGCLLVGPPGSGKTLLAKAVAGEARVPFFTISGSDFVEMFVGVGASRVRDLFEQARKAAPCIIFIDEIDAVGRKRGSGMNGGNDEREQTLNQLLVEMDGFETKHDIIILAATNRPDVLDSALLRAGRFDRQVIVDAPDVKGREEILRVHSRKKPLEDNVDLKLVARRTPGMVGADLENLLNEAALLAARGGRRRIGMKDLDEAADRVTMGPARKSRVINDADKRITAYHEVGHALAANLLPNADRVHKLTIVPRGNAAGFMQPLPSEHQHLSRQMILTHITVFMAGRAAEELEFGDVTTGAQNDFQRATELGRKMVGEWGMSQSLGHVALIEENQDYLGMGIENRNYSNATAKAIDLEVKTILESCYDTARALLERNQHLMMRVVDELLLRETLNAEEFQILLDGGQLPDDDSSNSKDGDETSGLTRGFLA